MHSSSANHIEKFGKSKKEGREKISKKRDNKKMNKTIRGRREEQDLYA